jgi:putative drug exporter of the RND superfamily
MTARLARLADIAYRRRGRMVIAWIIAILGAFALNAAFAGKFQADYSTPGSESKQASHLIEQRFGGYSGSTIDVVWKADKGATAGPVKQKVNSFLTEASKLDGVGQPQPTRVGRDGKIAATGLQLTKQPWDISKETGEDLISLANRHSGDGLEIKLGGGPIQQAQSGNGPEGYGLLGAAIVLLIAFGSVVAAGLPIAIALFGLGISSALIGLLAGVIDVPDWSMAIAGLMGIGVGVDYARSSRLSAPPAAA